VRRSLRRPHVNVNFFFFQDIITAALGVILFIALILALNINTEAEPGATSPPTASELADEKQLSELIASLAENRKKLESLRSVAGPVDKAALLKQLQILRKEVADVTASMSAKTIAIPRSDNSRAIDEALQGGKDDLASVEKATAALKEKLAVVQQSVNDLELQIKDMEARLLAQEQLKNKIWLIPQTGGTSKEPLLITVATDGYELQRYGKKDEKKVMSGGSLPTLLRDGLKEFPKEQYYVVLYFKPSALSRFEVARDTVSGQGYEVGTDVITEDTVLDFSPPE